MKTLLNIFLIFIFSACTLQKKSGDFDTISIGGEDERDLSIDPNQNGDYGPMGEEDGNSSEAISSNNLVHGLSVYSTLYSSFALVELFAAAEKKKINFSIIAANGFASLISVLYAKKKSSNYLEWKLFDLNKRLKDSTPFSRSWESVIRDFLEEEFKDMQLQQLKALVVIPEKVNGVTILSSTGSVVEKVMKTLSLKNKGSFYLSPFDYTDKMKTLGLDMNLSVAFTADKTNFNTLSGFQWGLYTTYLSFIENNRHLFQSVNALDTQTLDMIVPLSDVKTSYRKSINEVLQEYDQKIEDWNSQNSTSAPLDL